MSAYADTLAGLFSRTAAGIKLGLEPTQELLGELGHPEQRLGRVTLVAGTNGKGSTAALIAAALTAAGHRVGFFSSPHLLQFSERIRIGDDRIPRRKVVEHFETIQRVESRCSRPPTFFECTTAIAVMHFADAGVDATVLEVGLGGRLDATNAVPRDLAVMTPIAFDHQRFLGDDLASIAAEKAAIIPFGGRVVTAAQADPAMRVIELVASQRQATVITAPDVERIDDCLRFDGGPLDTALTFDRFPRPPYQHVNLATAIAACVTHDRAGLAVPTTALRAAAAHLKWPGRYQWLLADRGRIAPEVDLLIDGAHNPAAIAALLDALGLDPRAAGRPAHCVFSALRDKAAALMLAGIEQRSTSTHLCPLPSHRSLTQADLRRLSRNARVYSSARAAIEGATERAEIDGGFVLITGSLVLAGEALAIAGVALRDPPFER